MVRVNRQAVSGAPPPPYGCPCSRTVWRATGKKQQKMGLCKKQTRTCPSDQWTLSDDQQVINQTKEYPLLASGCFVKSTVPSSPNEYSMFVCLFVCSIFARGVQKKREEKRIRYGFLPRVCLGALRVVPESR